MMDTPHTNAYLDKIVEYYKDCQNDRKEIVASPCYKLEYRNQSEEQILYEYLKNHKSKTSQQENHLNGSLDGNLRERSTPNPSFNYQNGDSLHLGQTHSDLSLSSTLHNSYHQENFLLNSIQTENKPNQGSERGKDLLASLRSKGKAQAQRDEKLRAASPSSSTLLAQPKIEELDTSSLDVSNLDISRIEERNERLNQSGVSDLTLDNEGDYPDKKEKARLAEQPDLLNQTLRGVEPKKREKEVEEEKQSKQVGDSSQKISRIEELRRQAKEKTAAEQRKLEQEKLEVERKKREEEERLRFEAERAERAERLRERVEIERIEREEIERRRLEEEKRKREQEEIERKKREEERRRIEEMERQRQRENARLREIEFQREKERVRLEAQIKEEKEAKERQRIKEEQLRKEEEEEEKREKERLRIVNEEAEERKRKREEARSIAEQLKNQRDVIDDTVQSIREELNPVPKQSEGPFYNDKNGFNMQNSFSFQQGSLHESQYDTTPGSPKSQTSERLREQRGEGTTNLLNGIKGSRRINREDSRHGSNVDSSETRDRFETRSTSGQRTIPDRLKRIEELLEKVLENQINLERKLDKIEKTQDDHTEMIEDIRDNLIN